MVSLAFPFLLEFPPRHCILSSSGSRFSDIRERIRSAQTCKPENVKFCPRRASVAIVVASSALSFAVAFAGVSFATSRLKSKVSEAVVALLSAYSRQCYKSAMPLWGFLYSFSGSRPDTVVSDRQPPFLWGICEGIRSVLARWPENTYISKCQGHLGRFARFFAAEFLAPRSGVTGENWTVFPLGDVFFS